MHERTYKTGYICETFDYENENGEWISATKSWHRTFNGARRARTKAGSRGVIYRIIDDDYSERVL